MTAYLRFYYITESVKLMLRLQAASNLKLTDIKQHLTKLENALKNHTVNISESNDLINHFLPLDTIDKMHEFEELLKNTDEAVTLFVNSYIIF